MVAPYEFAILLAVFSTKAANIFLKTDAMFLNLSIIDFILPIPLVIPPTNAIRGAVNNDRNLCKNVLAHILKFLAVFSKNPLPSALSDNPATGNTIG